MTAASQSSVIDVIIPVYRGLAAVRRCIDSVFAAALDRDIDIILVDDASPEPELSDWLASLEHPGLLLLVNEQNLGFVGSVNRAAAVHPERDFIILNADTEVGDGWADRLCACAAAHPDVATVTPFSNNGSIASFPAIDQVNPLPGDYSVGQLDSLFAAANAGECIEIPVGVGFCLFVRREAWAACDGFDSVFGRGYGEEVDFCMEASAKGWRHVLAADVFVYHEGSVSFGRAEVPELQAKAQRIIDERYPQFPALVSAFYDDDPLAASRHRAIAALLAQSTKPRVLMVSHSWGGGVDKHVTDLADALVASGQANVLLFQPAPGKQGTEAVICSMDMPGFEVARGALESTPDAWLAVLQSLGLAQLHYHHMVEFPAWVLDLPRQLDLPYLVTIHDFWPVCPQLHFIASDDTYCGRPNIAGCRACVDERPDPWGLGIDDWRARIGSWMSAADRVIAPTTSAANAVTDYMPDVSVEVLPHIEVGLERVSQVAITAERHRKIAILGNLSPAKGLDVVEAVIQQTADSGAPIDYVVIGATSRGLDVPTGAPVTVLGSYRDEDLDHILLRERVDGFWFASVIPETYGYAMSIAMATQLPIIAGELGAYGERLNQYPPGVALPKDHGPEQVIETILGIPKDQKPAAGVQLIASSEDGYVRGYLQDRDLDSASVGALDTAALPAALAGLGRADPLEPGEKMPMTDLLEKALDCGQQVALAHLRWRAVDEEWNLGRLEAQRERDIGEIAHLKGVIPRLKAAHETHANNLEARIAQQLAALDSRDRELSEARDVLAKVEGGVSGFTDRIEELERYEAHLLSELERERSRITVLTESVTARDEQVVVLARRINELEGSTFWRMTAPLRAAASTLKSLLSRTRTLRRFVVFLRYHYALGGFAGLMAAVKRRLGRRGEAVPTISSVAPAKTAERPDSIVLMTSVTPEVSIVIPSYGEHEVTRQCLASIAEHPPAVPFEVIVADDAYAEPFDAEALSVMGARILRQPDNLGFLRNCNAAMNAAAGEFLLLLNNDTLVHGGSLDALRATFAAHTNVGAVGAMLLSSDGTVQEAGGIVWSDASAWNWGRFLDPEDPQFGYMREVDYCSAAALMVSREAWEQVGGFDERFAPAYYEDTDLCMALRDVGYSVLYQPRARVTHLEGVSHGTDVSAGVKSRQVHNQAVFLEKWQHRLIEHAANAQHPELERDRQAVRRILWVEACVLTPDQDSGSLRTLRLFRILLELGCKITFVADNLLRDEPYVQQLQQEGIEVLYAPYVTSVEQYLQEHGGQFDVITLCRHYIAIKYAALIKARYPNCALWFDTIDLHYLRLRRQYKLDGRDATRSLSELAYREEMEVIGLSDVTLVVSDVEVAELKAEAPGRQVAVLSNIHEPQGDVPGVESRQGIMFVGGFQHPPNVDAVEYFATEIWPSVRDANPGIEAHIIGSKMPESLRQTGEAAGLTMHGFVDDLTPFYHESMLAIAPLRYGAGVKGKVNQALSFGLPVLGSAMAFEGMAVRDGEDVMIADEAQAFITAINRVLEDPDLWGRLSANGQASLGREFSTAVARTTVCGLLSLTDPGAE